MRSPNGTDCCLLVSAIMKYRPVAQKHLQLTLFIYQLEDFNFLIINYLLHIVINRIHKIKLIQTG
jgi:hypothetical protein